MSPHVDYLIVGQGLAGSALAWELSQRNKSFIVFDDPAANRASAVAAGIFNPVTGKVMAKSYKANTYFPFFEKFYTEAEKNLNAKFFHSLPIYRPFVSPDEKEQWRRKSETDELKNFVLKFHEGPSFEQIHNPYGGIEMASSGYLDVQTWMLTIRKFLIEKNIFVEGHFDEQEVLLDDVVRYKEFTADKIIFCNGLHALKSKWFGYLPLKPLKGETLELELPSIPARIFNRGVYIVPGSGKSTFIIGATYQHVPFVEGPSAAAREDLLGKFEELTAMPFKVVHQEWGIRPTTPDRRPLLGEHPTDKKVIIFNGLGTKGVSLAPYFAHLLAQWLEGGGDLLTEVNIYRYKALYSK